MKSICYTHVWYRTTVTMPQTVGTFPVTGSRVLFEVVADNYSEVWAALLLTNRTDYTCFIHHITHLHVSESQ